MYYYIFVFLTTTFLAIYFYLTSRTPKPIDTEIILKDGGKFVKTEDGNVLEYFVSGDPNGTPLLLFPGFSQTGKLYACESYSDIFKELKLKCYAVTLPGFGNSSYHPRTIGGWAKEVEYLLKDQNIDKFYVLGYSFGGGHAASVGSYFGKRCLGVEIISSQWDQYNGPKEISMSFGLKVLSYFKYTPWFLDGLFWITLKLISLINVEMIYQQQPEYNSLPKDVREATIADVYRTIHCHKGMTGCFVDVTTSPWDFDMSKLNDCERVILGRGKDDDISPKAVINWYSSYLKNSDIIEYEGQHLSFLVNLKSFVEKMVYTEIKV